MNLSEHPVGSASPKSSPDPPVLISLAVSTPGQTILLFLLEDWTASSLFAFFPFILLELQALFCTQQHAQESFKNINWIKGTSFLNASKGLLLNLELTLNLLFRLTHRPLCFAPRLPLTYCSSATGVFPSLEHTRLLPASGSLHLLISLLGTLCPMAYLDLNPSFAPSPGGSKGGGPLACELRILLHF